MSAGRSYIYRASSAIAFIDPLRTFRNGAYLSLSPRLKSNARLSYRDVVEVRHMFVSKLPYELVDTILEMARCWAYMSTECKSFLGIRASNSPNTTANFMISISEPIPEHTPVKSVQFQIHSQEYSTDSSSTYSWSPYDSSTWFEASILRPSGIPKPLPRSAINMNSLLEVSKFRKLGWTEICNPRDRRSRRWKVQANDTGSLPKLHSVTWEPTNDAGETTFDDECDRVTGKGSGLGFIQTLRAGDRIALLGRALWYQNHIYSTKIEIACQA